MEPWIDWADSAGFAAARRFHLEFDDAVQIARLGAWKAFHAWRGGPDGSVDHERYVRRKAYLAVIDALRNGAGYGSEVGRYSYADGERFDPLRRRADAMLASDGVVFDRSHEDTVDAACDLAAASCDLQRVLSMIPPREAAVVTLVDLEGCTLQAVGDAIGLSESRVCQIRKKAFERMRPLLAA